MGAEKPHAVTTRNGNTNMVKGDLVSLPALVCLMNRNVAAVEFAAVSNASQAGPITSPAISTQRNSAIAQRAIAEFRRRPVHRRLTPSECETEKSS